LQFPDFSVGLVGGARLALARQILTQLRWLDYLVEPAKTIGKLMELMSLAPVDVQREIILALPEIVGDAEHKAIVSSLMEAVQSNLSLIVPVTDTLMTMNLDPTLLVWAAEHHNQHGNRC